MRKKYRDMDLSGRRFGALTVIERSPNNHPSSSSWVCRCDCGNTVTVAPSNLINGVITSCGCQLWKGMQRNRSSYHPTDVYPRNGRYFAMITWKSKQYALGYYDTMEEAIAARNGAKKIISALNETEESHA